MKITKAKLHALAMFTVLDGRAIRAARARNRSPHCWAIFELDGGTMFSDTIAEIVGAIRPDLRLTESIPCRCDDGAPKAFTDDDAVLEALNAGHALIKLPDEIGSQFYRFYVCERTPAKGQLVDRVA